VHSINGTGLKSTLSIIAESRDAVFLASRVGNPLVAVNAITILTFFLRP
jgi:hypothetical protein